jgi:hypothetical protein
MVEYPMSIRVKKIHPALKHGAYAATAVLPGEHRSAFEKLHRELIAELAPSERLRTISSRPSHGWSGASKILQRFVLRSSLETTAGQSDRRNSHLSFFRGNYTKK